MSSTREAGDLIDRCRATLDSARAACVRSTALVHWAGAARAHARRTRAVIARRRVGPSDDVAGFRVTGLVSGQRVVAMWEPGQGLVCPDALRARAEVVVALGESFGDEALTVTASLDDPTAAMLTVLRALSRVSSLEIFPDAAALRARLAADATG